MTQSTKFQFFNFLVYTVWAASFSYSELEKYKYYQKDGTDNTNYIIIYVDDVPIERKQLSTVTLGTSLIVKVPHTNFEVTVKIQVTGNGLSKMDWWGIKTMDVHVLRPPIAKMHLKYGEDVTTLPDMWTNVTAEDMTAVLQQIPGQFSYISF